MHDYRLFGSLRTWIGYGRNPSLSEQFEISEQSKVNLTVKLNEDKILRA